MPVYPGAPCPRFSPDFPVPDFPKTARDRYLLCGGNAPYQAFTPNLISVGSSGPGTFPSIVSSLARLAEETHEKQEALMFKKRAHRKDSIADLKFKTRDKDISTI
jgi:hypothetical protein